MGESTSMRTEVLEFMRASEVLLSAALRTREFSEEECSMIAEYITTLSASANPSKELLVRYNF